MGNYTDARIIADSVNGVTGDRIITALLIYPWSIHDQMLTHHVLFSDDGAFLNAYDAEVPFSAARNSASGRAIPTTKMIEWVRSTPFIPRFRLNKKGMQPGEHFSEDMQHVLSAHWLEQMESAIFLAESYSTAGVAKETINSLLKPFAYTRVLYTFTEFNNFLLLRDHPMAQEEIQVVAQRLKAAISSSTPTVLQPGEWHTPYADAEPRNLRTRLKISVARCARTSYISNSTNRISTEAEDLDLFDRLTGAAPKHLSPTEHQAEAMPFKDRSGCYWGWTPLRKLWFRGEEAGGDNY